MCCSKITLNKDDDGAGDNFRWEKKYPVSAYGIRQDMTVSLAEYQMNAETDEQQDVKC